MNNNVNIQSYSVDHARIAEEEASIAALEVDDVRNLASLEFIARTHASTLMLGAELTRPDLVTPARALLATWRDAMAEAFGRVRAAFSKPQAPMVLLAAPEPEPALDHGPHLDAEWEAGEAEVAAAKAATRKRNSPSPMAAWAADVRRRSSLRRDDQMALAAAYSDERHDHRSLALTLLPNGKIALDGRWNTRKQLRVHSWLALVRQCGRAHETTYLAGADGLKSSAFVADGLAVGDVLEAGMLSRNARGRVKSSDKRAYLVLAVDVREKCLRLESFECARDAFSSRKVWLEKREQQRNDKPLARHIAARNARGRAAMEQRLAA